MTSLRHNPAERGEAGPRDAYLDAARDCILDVGWRRTTLTEVARRAGVSRMTIYRSWPEMASLLADLMTREWTAVVEAAAAEQPEGDGAVERLVGTITATVRALRDNELILPYLLERRGRSQDLVLELTEAAVAEGQRAGEVREGDATAMARALLLTAHGFVLSAHTMVDDAVALADLDAELAALLTRALAR